MFRHSSTGKSGIGHGKPSIGDLVKSGTHHTGPSSGRGYSPRRSFSAHPRHSSGAGRPHANQQIRGLAASPRPAGRGFHKSYAPRGRAGFGSRGGGSRGRGGPPGQHIDISRFINKAVITETTEHFKPEHNFADFAIDEHLKKNILAKGYFEPTPIQDRAIPHVLRGDDVFGVANTGTGKTGAFLVPLIDKVIRDRKTRVLIMVPTRELATQIEDEFWSFAKHLRIGAVTCVGGANIGPQISTLRRNPSFVIGTPGRLKDIIERRALNLSEFSTVVLDEADRMLDMGFIDDMRFILSLVPKERHTLFFSATLSRDIEKLIGDFLKDPIRISVKTRDTAAGVEQDVVRVPSGKTKIDVLHDLLIKPGFGKVLIFGRTKHGVEKLAKDLVHLGFKATSIHGNKTQSNRQKSLDAFKQDRIQILVATDVAARGLDIPKVSHVINYDVPNTYDDYVHRIGRTGRAGEKGQALTFVDGR
ncbi:MAG: DEAD/DEAH box helicase [bacterium]|nr:DEAD/DEAH box helicase [bacterium]